MRRRLWALALLPLTAACSGVPGHSATSGDSAPSALSLGEIAMAEAVARDVIADQGASVTSATAVARRGTVEDSNTGHPCTSGRLLRIKLIGDFPHTVTTGHPVKQGEPMPDFTVRAVIVTADAGSGRACLIGVQTAENGEPQPLPGGTLLAVGTP